MEKTHKTIDFVCIGNAVVDILHHIDDETLNALDLKRGDFQRRSGSVLKYINSLSRDNLQAGGSLANTAFALAKLGKKVSFLSVCGSDKHGKFFLSAMKKAGVKVCATTTNIITRAIHVLISPDAERTFVSEGSNADITPQFITSHEHTISRANYLLLESYMLIDKDGFAAMKKAIKLAKKHGTKTILTLAAPKIVIDYHDEISALINLGLDLIIANEKELTSLEFGAKDDPKLVDKINSTPRVITSGSKGASFYTIADTPKGFIGARYVENVIDTTGAGDAFAAGFLSQWAPDETTLEAVVGGLIFGQLLAQEVIQVTGAHLPETTKSPNPYIDILRRYTERTYLGERKI